MATENQQPARNGYDFRVNDQTVAIAYARSYAHARRLASAQGFQNYNQLEEFPLPAPKLPQFKLND